MRHMNIQVAIALNCPLIHIFDMLVSSAKFSLEIFKNVMKGYLSILFPFMSIHMIAKPVSPPSVISWKNLTC